MAASDVRSAVGESEETATTAVMEADTKSGDPFLAAVGRRVREVRLARGLSRRALSERSGVSPRFIAHLEAGEGNISIARLKEIADALAIPVARLVAADSAPADGFAATDEAPAAEPRTATGTPGVAAGFSEDAAPSKPSGRAGMPASSRASPPAGSFEADPVPPDAGVSAARVRGDPDPDEMRRLGQLIARASPSQRRRAFAALGAAQDERARRVALIGLRGAGKSTLGAAVAARLGLPFVELNREIEAASGLAVAEIFALYGEDGYRALERRALEAVADRHDSVILAVAGGIVGEAATFERLLDRFTAVWLRASPDEHMARVIAQGDGRPMAGNPAAMDQLKAILKARETHYARAPLTLDTSGRSPAESTDALAALLAHHLEAPAFSG